MKASSSWSYQAKLYQDTIHNLQRAHVLLVDLEQGPGNDDFTARQGNYVQKIEDIFQTEQGQWGQLAKKVKPAET